MPHTAHALPLHPAHSPHRAACALCVVQVSLGVELSDAVEAPPRYSLDAVVAEQVSLADAELADADAPPSFELLDRLSAPLRRFRARSELARVDAASETAETREKRADLRRQAWWQNRGKRLKKPPVVRRVGLLPRQEDDH